MKATHIVHGKRRDWPLCQHHASTWPGVATGQVPVSEALLPEAKEECAACAAASRWADWQERA